MKFNTFKKVVSLTTVICFIFTNTTYATPSNRSLFQNKKVDYKKLSAQSENQVKQKQSILQTGDEKAEVYTKEAKRILSTHLSDLSQIHLPSELGRVVEVYQAPLNESRTTNHERLIIHIQDLHTNPEAQYNLAGILDLLTRDYNMGLVCSEGADGVVDTSSIASFPDIQAKEKVSRIFVNSGELTGEEFLSITKYPQMPIWGIEDRGIYFKNIIEFNKIMKFTPSSQVFISQAQKAMDALKEKILTKELLSLGQKEADYEAKKIETDEYLKFLSSYIQKFNLSIDRYKNIALLAETIEKESKIDQAKIMTESQNLLINLKAYFTAKNIRSDSDSLMAQAELFASQKISPFSFYSYLKDLALRHIPDGLEAKYPALTEFIDYLTKINSLDSTRLFNEMEDLSYEVKMRLAKNTEQELFIKALRNIKFLEGFFNLKVSNEELDYYLEDRISFRVGFFESFLKPALKKYNVSNFVDFNPVLIDSHLQELEDFYVTVKERDEAMVNNALSEIEKRNVKVATLIAGGFHTKGITRLLKEKGYSYIVVSPYSATDIDEENYHFLLSGRRKPIVELLKQLDLPEIVTRLSKSLRVPLSLDADLVEAFNAQAAPVIAKLLDISPEEATIQNIRHRISMALGLQRGAELWDACSLGLEIKRTTPGRIVMGCKGEDGKPTYLVVTATALWQGLDVDFREPGEIVASIKPGEKQVEVAEAGADAEIALRHGEGSGSRTDAILEIGILGFVDKQGDVQRGLNGLLEDSDGGIREAAVAVIEDLEKKTGQVLASGETLPEQLSKVKILAFDYGNVLHKINLGTLTEELVKPFGLNEAQVLDFVSNFSDGSPVTLHEEGNITFGEYYGLFTQNVEGGSKVPFDTFREVFLRILPFGQGLGSALIEAIKKYKSMGYRIVVAATTNMLHLTEIIIPQLLRLKVVDGSDDIIASCDRDIQTLKKNPEFWRRTFMRLGISETDAAQVAFFDDTEDNIDAAEAAGVVGVQFKGAQQVKDLMEQAQAIKEQQELAYHIKGTIARSLANAEAGGQQLLDGRELSSNEALNKIAEGIISKSPDVWQHVLGADGKSAANDIVMWMGWLDAPERFLAEYESAEPGNIEGEETVIRELTEGQELASGDEPTELASSGTIDAYIQRNLEPYANGEAVSEQAVPEVLSNIYAFFATDVIAKPEDFERAINSEELNGKYIIVLAGKTQVGQLEELDVIKNNKDRIAISIVDRVLARRIAEKLKDFSETIEGLFTGYDLAVIHGVDRDIARAIIRGV